MSNRGRGRGVWGRISQPEQRPGADRPDGSARIQQRLGAKIGGSDIEQRLGAKIGGAGRTGAKMPESANARNGNFHDYWDDKPLDGRDVLIELMEKLNLDKADGQIIKRITKTVYDLCTSADNLEDMVNKLHDRSLEDAEFGRKAACVLGSVSQMEVGGVKLRDVLLRTIQADFKKRDQMRAKHPHILYNAVRLLCEVFKEVKLGDGSVISVLCVPILEYLHMLLDISSPASIQLVGLQLAQLGQELQVAQQDRVAKLMMRVRRGLVEEVLGEGEKSVLLRLLEMYLLRWPVLLPERVEEWYGAHREAFDCLVVVMEKETVASIYNEKDWVKKEVEGKKEVKEKDEDLEREKAITNMLREARISTEKDEGDTGIKKSKKVVVGGGLWGRALQDLEAADKAEKNKEEKEERGVEKKREDRVGRKGGSMVEDGRKENPSRWHDDRTNGHDYRTNGHEYRSNGHDDRTNGHDYRSNSYDNRANGHDYRKNIHNGKINGGNVKLNGQNDIRNSIGKGVKDRLGKVENLDINLGNEKKGENKENLGDGDLRGRLNRLKTSPGASGDWKGSDKIMNGGIVINVSNEDSRRSVEDASPDLSLRNVSLSPPTPDWKNEPPLEGNWADDLDSWE